MGKGMVYRQALLKSRGFTIVELLVVIVVIAILATITILSYDLVTERAHQQSVLTDLDNAASAMETYYTQNGGKSFATSITQLNNGAGVTASDNNTINFYSEGDWYCISVSSSEDGVSSYHVSDTSGKPQLGPCPQDFGTNVATVGGTGTLGYVNGVTGVSQVASPAGMTSGGTGIMYFTDGGSNRIRGLQISDGQTYLYAGSGTASYVNGTGTGATFNWPQAVTVDGSGNILVADANNHKIRKVTPVSGAGVATLFAGSTSGRSTTIPTAAASLQMNTPRGIAYDATTGDIIVADSQNNRIIRLDSTGALKAAYGSTSGTGAFADGNATTVRFNYPEGIAVDTNGNIIVADSNNNRIRKITPAGVTSTIAGQTLPGTIDGTGTGASFNKPGGVAVSSKGVIYVSDTTNNKIRRISTTGVVSSLAGNGTAGFSEGRGEAAQFNGPMGLALGSNGKLYVSDVANHRIRVLDVW